MAPEEALRTHFGLTAFRPRQDEIVRAVVSGRDALVIMPTGGGKSLCYQLPAMLRDGCALVVSPLIALMKDQVDALGARGIPATCINSMLSPGEQAERIRDMVAGRYKLVYIAPERFRQRSFTEALQRAQISFVAVDEAHCVSQWGHDFRPDYLRVGEAVQKMGRPQVCGFTATATPEVRADIVTHLGMEDPETFVTGFARPNLSFKVSAVDTRHDKLDRLRSLIAEQGTGLIYCATRKRVEEVSGFLEDWHIPHVMYHGGMDDASREAEQNRFIRGEVKVAVATNAFGMGIDRADIRFVAHFDMPGSVEAYYQEAGRAGRDGLPAHAELLYNYADRNTQDFFIDGSNPPPDFIRQVYAELMERMDAGAEVKLSIQELSDALEERNGMMVSSALKILNREGHIERFDISGERIRGTRITNTKLFPPYLEFDEAALAEKERRDRERLQAVIRYATGLECRQKWLRGYFGEKVHDTCGCCDICDRDDVQPRRKLDEAEFVILQKLLSGVARMSTRGFQGKWEPRFGKGLIVQMLTGSREKRIRQFNLEQLSTFGLLARQGVRFVRELIDECLHMGLLYSTGGERPLVSLTPMGDAAMRGNIEVKLHWPQSKAVAAAIARGKAKVNSKEQAPSSRLVLSSDDPDPDLLERLKKKRLQLSMQRGKIPPFHIFSNRTLEALAALQPVTREEALDISGIGPTKADKWLPHFLDIIRDHRKRL